MSKTFQKFIISILLIITAFFISNAGFAHASSNFGLDEAQQATSGSVPKTIGGQQYVAGLIGYVVNAILGFLGIVFFLIILYAGIRWMLAMGKAEEATKAKDMMEAAIIGLIIVVGAYAIAKFLFSSLDTGGGGNPPAAQTDCTVPANDAKGCGDFMVCKNSACVSKCVAVNGANSICQATTIACAGAYTPNLCPGSANIQCCH